MLRWTWLCAACLPWSTELAAAELQHCEAYSQPCWASAQETPEKGVIKRGARRSGRHSVTQGTVQLISVTQRWVSPGCDLYPASLALHRRGLAGTWAVGAHLAGARARCSLVFIFSHWEWVRTGLNCLRKQGNQIKFYTDYSRLHCLQDSSSHGNQKQESRCKNTRDNNKAMKLFHYELSQDFHPNFWSTSYCLRTDRRH